MAVTWRCVTQGLRLGPGSKRLVAARWLLIVLSSLPAHAAARMMLASGPARSPYFTLEPGPLPLVHLGHLFAEVPAALAVAFACAGLAVLGEQYLLAGAVALLGKPSAHGRTRVLAALHHSGSAFLRPFLALVVAGVLLGGAGAAALSGLLRLARHHGEVAGWSGHTLRVALPALGGGLILLWMSVLGSWLLYTRVLLVLGEGPGVARAAWAAAGVIRRHPIVALVFPMAISLGCLAATSGVLAAWLAAEPATAAGVAGWVAAMLGVLGVQAFAWHWMVHAACLAARGACRPGDSPEAGT